MDFIQLEAEVDNSDDDDSFIYSDDLDNSFIDDAWDTSESVCGHYAFPNVEVNIANVLKNANKNAVSDIDDASEFTNFLDPALAQELTGTVTFCSQKIKK